MSCPLYFFPRTRADEVTQADRFKLGFLEKRGVAPAFAGIESVSQQASLFECTGKGPGGGTGMFLTVVPNGVAPLRLGHYPEFQIWAERPAGADCWVAIDREHPPQPHELAIGQPKGHSVKLGDGNTWTVPIIRSPQGGRSQLPSDFIYDGNGNPQIVRDPATDRLWELAGEVWDHTVDRANHPLMPAGSVMELALGSLAMNYRVGRVEATLLRLFGSANWEKVMEAVLDWPAVEEMLIVQKKTASHPLGS